MRRLRIFTWHVHGSYLYYLSRCPHDFYLPVKQNRQNGYFGRTESYPWPDNVHEIPAEEVSSEKLDCILFQSHQNYLGDQHDILSEMQKKLPRIFLEHDPPRESPTDTFHPIDDPDILLVHVTPFNQLMWNSQRTPSIVIDHGVIVPDTIKYSGEKDQGVTVVNHITKRGRRLGADIFERVREVFPIDLFGMGWEEARGRGEIRHSDLPEILSHYRFFFNPIRYTSMPLSVCEAMMIGMPIIGLATTEMARVIENGVSGFVDTQLETLIERMRELLHNRKLAKALSMGAKKAAQDRFNIHRFIRNWDQAFREVAK